MRDRANAIRDIREFNRYYTNVLGLLDRYVLESGYSLTEARILFELGETGPCIANTLSARLQIDKSYLSRLLAGFERKGLVRRETANEDGRASRIELTDQGAACIRDLNERSNRHIGKLLYWLSDRECGEVFAAMETIRERLSRAGAISIRPYTKQDIGFVINGQLDLYGKEFGFTSDVWRAYVADAVHKLDDQFDPERDRMVILEHNGVPSGCIAVAHAGEHTAQLRFFFLNSALRGMGIGSRLMELALDFCREKQYRRVFLLTNSDLGAARHLYGKSGFRLADSRVVKEWGEAFVEERWELELP